jgi:hypothetical protein
MGNFFYLVTDSNAKSEFTAQNRINTELAEIKKGFGTLDFRLFLWLNEGNFGSLDYSHNNFNHSERIVNADCEPSLLRDRIIEYLRQYEVPLDEYTAEMFFASGNSMKNHEHRIKYTPDLYAIVNRNELAGFLYEAGQAGFDPVFRGDIDLN